jgi:hypothetical protein
MAADQLAVDLLVDVLERELARLLCDLAVECDLEEEVAQFVGEPVGVVVVDRVDRLVRLLDHRLPDGGMGLLAIPRASRLAPELGGIAGACGASDGVERGQRGHPDAGEVVDRLPIQLPEGAGGDPFRAGGCRLRVISQTRWSSG